MCVRAEPIATWREKLKRGEKKLSTTDPCLRFMGEREGFVWGHTAKASVSRDCCLDLMKPARRRRRSEREFSVRGRTAAGCRSEDRSCKERCCSSPGWRPRATGHWGRSRNCAASCPQAEPFRCALVLPLTHW